MTSLRTSAIIAAFLAALASTADARTSVHVRIGVPFWSPFFYAPAFIYAPPPVPIYYPAPARYIPRDREVIRTYREDGCRVTERKIYDADGYVVDRDVRRDCRDSDRRWIEED